MSNYCQACGTEVATQYRICPGCGGRDLRPTRPGAAAPVAQAVQQQAYVQPVMQQASPPAAAPWPPAATALVTPRLAGGRGGYGGFWRRTGAYLIDIFLFVLLFFLVGIVLAIVAPGADPQTVEPLFNVVGLLVWWLYFANMESGPLQATLGKKALGMKVCDEQGQRISFGRASGRFFGKILSSLILGIGFLMVGFTDRKQGLHDKIASTLVTHQAE